MNICALVLVGACIAMKVKTKTVKIFLKNYTIYGRQWYSTISLTLYFIRYLVRFKPPPHLCKSHSPFSCCPTVTPKRMIRPPQNVVMKLS